MFVFVDVLTAELSGKGPLSLKSTRIVDGFTPFTTVKLAISEPSVAWNIPLRALECFCPRRRCAETLFLACRGTQLVNDEEKNGLVGGDAPPGC